MDSTNGEPVKGFSAPATQSAPNETTALSVRELPHSIDAEQALLGAILIDNGVLETIEGLVEAADFFDPLHHALFDEIAATVARGHLASPVTLAQTFESYPPITPDMPVPRYLGRLLINATTTRHAPEYARLIHSLAMRRAVITIGEAMVDDAYTAPAEVTGEEHIEMAEQRLMALAENGRADTAEVTFAHAVDVAIEAANAAYERGGALAGLSTGLVDLDRMLGGLAPSDLIILAGRPSMGKTALATNIGIYNARKWFETGGNAGAKVMFYSLEMSDQQLGTRVLGEHASIPSEKIRRGSLDENDFRRLVQAAAEIRDIPFYIDQTGGLPLARLAARARRAKRKYDFNLLIVDYLQLMSGSQSRREGNRVQEVTEITTGLKALAKELNVPILALSQLSRAVEQRADKRPQLSDLRESGSIEQDADVVMFVFREEYYLERDRPPIGDTDAQAIWDVRMREAAGKGEVIIGKQRHGPTGTVMVAFDGTVTKFSNLAREGI
jgi:replicative DNA helicase